MEMYPSEADMGIVLFLSLSLSFFFLFLVFNWLTGPGLGEIPEGKGPTR